MILVFPNVSAGIHNASTKDNYCVGNYWFERDSAGDYSENENNGTLTGVTNTTGIVGYAYEFDGDNDYIRIENSLGEVYNNSIDNTICLWFYKKGDSKGETNSYIISHFITGTPGNRLYIWDEGDDEDIDFRIGSATSSNALSFALNEWHHLCTIVTNNTFSAYGDGIEIVSDTSYTHFTTQADFYIGADSTSAFNGTLDEIIIFNRTLSSGEISSLYNTSKDTTPPNVTITSPTSYQNFTQSNMDIDITYTIEDNQEIKKIYYRTMSDTGECSSNTTLNDSLSVTSVSESASITLCAYGTYELFIYADDYVGNINSTESVNFTIPSPPFEESTSGGATGGLSGEEPTAPISGSVETSTVEAVTQPIGDPKTYTDTQKAVLYSEISNFITEFSADYTSDQLKTLQQTLQGRGLIFTPDLLKLWIDNYLAGITSKVQVSGGDVLKFILIPVDVEIAKIISSPPIVFREAIKGYMFDQFFFSFSKDTKWIMVSNSTKNIVKCDVIKGPEQFTCSFLDNQTIKFEYNYLDKDFSKTEIVKIALLDKDLSTIYIEGSLRVFNIDYRLARIKGIYILSIIVIFISYFILKKRKRKKKT